MGFIMLMMQRVLAVLVLACLCTAVLSDYQEDALRALKASLNVPDTLLTDWERILDPCYWSHVLCDSSSNIVCVNFFAMNFSGILSPRIGVLKTLQLLVLNGNGITGKIPEEFGNLSSLTTLNLENNRLIGQIPSSLGNLKKLRVLTLSQNNLNGTIPQSLTGLPHLVSIQLDSNNLNGQIPARLFQMPTYNFTGNNLNCGKSLPYPCESSSNDSGDSKKTKIGIIFGSVGGCLVLLFTIFLILWYKAKYIAIKHDVFVDVAGEDVQSFSFGELKRYSFWEIKLAANNFGKENIIGQGGYGKVYKGELVDNTKVAIKRSTDSYGPGGEVAFKCEVQMISVARHKNVLQLIGFCTTASERILVYPFMQNLSLAYHLREIKPGELVLDWATRKRIALGAARGLEYLHEHCTPKIIHRDVKAANVLLDEDFEAVVGDFGLAKFVDVRNTHVTTQVRGTIGHIAPDYLSSGHASEKTDVYGYGITLLELVTGQRAMEFSLLKEEKEDGVSFLDYVKKLERKKRLDAVVDHNLNKNFNIQEVEFMIQIALLCTQESPMDRPAMSEIIRMLEGEGLAERWAEWEQLEVIRGQHYDIDRIVVIGEDSV